MAKHLQNISSGSDNSGKDAKNAERIIRSAINVSRLPCFVDLVDWCRPFSRTVKSPTGLIS